MNGDPTKPEIAFGQQYFAVATRTLEVVRQRVGEAARLQAREKLTETKCNSKACCSSAISMGRASHALVARATRCSSAVENTKTMKEIWGVPDQPSLD